jgi:hypothetical protein
MNRVFGHEVPLQRIPLSERDPEPGMVAVRRLIIMT